MKNIQLLSGIALIALSLTSCKDEKQEKAQKTIDAYVTYVDSVKNVKADDLKADWATVEAEYDRRAENAQLALADIKDNTAESEKINASKVKYEEFKKEMTTVLTPPAPSPKQQLRNALFGEGKIGDDMSFSWVNAQNIHSVYQQFVHTVEDNKDSYSREDWDEIKLLYEALDSRKNTVEKEGLTSEDNRKIAGLKMKFAPMYTVNRMGAKSDENREAKK
jgi:Asp-tRNA(Asn)/Glu-tRNA(Gln) amidotransferase C subunit